MRIGYESEDNWSIELFGENLGNADYFERGWANADSQNLNGFGLVNALVWPSKPRTFGLTFQHGFGG